MNENWQTCTHAGKWERIDGKTAIGGGDVVGNIFGSLGALKSSLLEVWRCTCGTIRLLVPKDPVDRSV